MNAAMSSGEVEAALPLLNNNRSGAKQGWPSELLRYAYQEVSGDDGKVSKFHVLSRVLAAILDAAFQSGVFPDAVKSSLVTPVFKKGDKSDPANYRPIAVGEPLCRLYAVILNRRIVSWSEDSGLRAPCQAGFRPHLSTEHQLFALRHFIERSKFRKQPMFTAFVDLKKAYDSVQHPLLWASLQRKGVHGKMSVAAIQSLYDGGTMSMKVSGKSGATGTAQVGVRQGCPLSPTLLGIFFDDLSSKLHSDCPLAGIECQGIRVPGLFYADDVALLSASAEGLQQLLDTMQAFCVANGLTISIPKTEVVVFGGGYHVCTWRVAGHVLQRSQSFTYLGMLFHEDRNIKHAIQSLFSKACGAVGSIFSRYANLECANSVQSLMRLQQAILQPCASYGCELWAPAAAVEGQLKQLQNLQHSFLRRACRVKKSVPIDIVFEELAVPRWHDFWWRRVLAFWTGLVQADASSICSQAQLGRLPPRRVCQGVRWPSIGELYTACSARLACCFL